MSSTSLFATPRSPEVLGVAGRATQATTRNAIHENYRSIRTDDDCRRRLFPGANRCADCHPREGVRLCEDGLTGRCWPHSRGFGLERRRGDGAFDRHDRAHLPSGWARRPYPDRATLRQRIRIVGALEDSSLRVPETGERKRSRSRRDWRASRCVRAHGRGMAARRSNRSAERRPRFDLRPRRAEPALRVSLFLSDGHRSASGHQARRWARLPQAMRRGRIRARRQLGNRRTCGDSGSDIEMGGTA